MSRTGSATGPTFPWLGGPKCNHYVASRTRQGQRIPTGSGPSSRGYAPGMTQPVTAGAGPEVGAARVRFRVPDPEAALEEGRLYQEVQRPRGGPAFTRDEAAAAWVLDFPRPAVDRMEYQLALRYSDAPQGLLAEPAKPLRAGGPV